MVDCTAVAVIIGKLLVTAVWLLVAGPLQPVAVAVIIEVPVHATS